MSYSLLEFDAADDAASSGITVFQTEFKTIIEIANWNRDPERYADVKFLRH